MTEGGRALVLPVPPAHNGPCEPDPDEFLRAQNRTEIARESRDSAKTRYNIITDAMNQVASCFGQFFFVSFLTMSVFWTPFRPYHHNSLVSGFFFFKKLKFQSLTGASR